MTGALWYPPADKVTQNFDGASFHRGPLCAPGTKPKLVLHTTEGWGNQWPPYGGGASAPHITGQPDYDAKKIRWRQHYPFDRYARALAVGPATPMTNNAGAIQVELCGTSGWASPLNPSAPYNVTPLIPDMPDWYWAEVGAFLAWLHVEHGVELRLVPGGFVSWGRSARMDYDEWLTFSGLIGHQHVPGNDHTDPGALPGATILEHAARIAGAPVMARRKPTAADIRNKEAELRLRGFNIYCGPSFYARGVCRPGNHSHSSDSRHFISPGMALDVGMDPPSGAAVSDHERAHLDLLMREFDADPYVDWRIRWRDPEGTHHDHLHVDDSSWFETKNVSGALAKDGVSVFISVRAFPKHVPPINNGFTLAYIAGEIQSRLKILGRYTGTPDGYKGTGTTAGIIAFQRDANLVDDGDPGAKTLAALKVAVAEHLAPKIPDPEPVVQPKPDPVPVPEPEPVADFPGGRLAGANRYDTAAQVARQAPVERQAKVYLAAEGTNDVAASASAGDGVVLLARSGGDVLPGVTAAALTDLPVRELVIVGGTASIPETVARQARHAASL